MPKVAIYCRLSEEDRGKANPTADSESIRNQKALLCRYAQERDWEIYQIYSDEDYAGADRRRPAFNQMLRDAEDGAFQIVLCKTQSRFTREVELVEKYLHGLFPLWGIRFVSVVDNADTQVRGNKKSRQINALVNEWYLEDLSDNIRTVLTAKRRQGQHIGASALYGYRKDPDRKGGLLPDPEAAEIVREIFRRYADGWGKTAIVRDLNRRGVPCPSAYKRLHGLPCGGKTGEIWREATNRLLTKPSGSRWLGGWRPIPEPIPAEKRVPWRERSAAGPAGVLCGASGSGDGGITSVPPIMPPRSAVRGPLHPRASWLWPWPRPDRN